MAGGGPISTSATIKILQGPIESKENGLAAL